MKDETSWFNFDFRAAGRRLTPLLSYGIDASIGAAAGTSIVICLVPRRQAGYMDLINATIIFVIIYSVSLFLTISRLMVRHKPVYNELGSPPLIGVSLRRFAKLVEFVLKLKFIELNDMLLNVLCVLFVVSFFVAITLIYMCAFSK
ncbi:hypothetical protein [Geomesophilobacter sediminis]|uniref:Uncharacterized protein n=1 Tax=Geomesophilobacter sediminis TaxID=2798584 RepID=A0A8J7SBD1_9BACT|nr:hypothetical protein [Geomesophilobacter sediminis]MBJ6728020.1 hypothetical protein [Geomesophilobacter sediminis]